MTYKTAMTLLGGRAKCDVACGAIFSHCATPSNRPVVRLWGSDAGVTYNCAKCSHSGFLRPSDGETIHRPIAPPKKEEPKKDTAKTAQWLWDKSTRLIPDSPQWKYLAGRAIDPSILSESIRCGVNPKSGLPYIISRYGKSDKVTAVHFTVVKPDGSGKADIEKPKFTLGETFGKPIIVSYGECIEHGQGIVIAEGVEDAASIAMATGFTAYAAGSGGAIPKVVSNTPEDVDLFLLRDNDAVGLKSTNSAYRIRPNLVVICLWKFIKGEGSRSKIDANKTLMDKGVDVLRCAFFDAYATKQFARKMF